MYWLFSNMFFPTGELLFAQKYSMFMYNKLLYLDNNINNIYKFKNLFKEAKIVSEKSFPKCSVLMLFFCLWTQFLHEVYKLSYIDSKRTTIDMFKTCYKILHTAWFVTEVLFIKHSTDILVVPFTDWWFNTQVLLLTQNLHQT